MENKRLRHGDTKKFRAAKIVIEELSSGESELFAAVFGSKAAVQIQMLVERLLGLSQPDLPSASDQIDAQPSADDMIDAELHLDANAAIGAIQRGGSSKVRYTRRTVGISIAWLAQLWTNTKRRCVKHVDGRELSADHFTKSLSLEPFGRHCAALGMEF